MRGELGFPSTHPGYRRAVLKPGGAAEIDDVEPGTAEFPRIDPRRTGRQHHTVFALTGSEGDWPLRRVSCLDPERGAVDGWSYPRRRIPEEHVFVPRREAEGDGWLIGPFLDVRPRHRAECVRCRASRRRTAVAGRAALPAASRAARYVRDKLIGVGRVTRVGGQKPKRRQTVPCTFFQCMMKAALRLPGQPGAWTSRRPVGHEGSQRLIPNKVPMDTGFAVAGVSPSVHKVRLSIIMTMNAIASLSSGSGL